MIAGIGKHIRRWRHTRGYGVHSPLAFRIIKECIRPDKRYGFYCDPYLEFEYHEDRKGLYRARMTVRILHLLRPKRVWMPDADKRLSAAIRMVMPGMHVATMYKECPKNVDFIVSFANRPISSLWKKMERLPECGMLVFGELAGEAEGATLEMEGHDFRILLRKTGMGKVRYEV